MSENRKLYVDNYKTIPKVDDATRLARWNKCYVCDQLEGEWIGGENRFETDDKKKDCRVEGGTAFWWTQFKDAKCPLGKW